jgi:oligopeptide transport system ATP-binding protein
MKPAELNRIRGNRVAMIFQDPMTSLNPYLTVERQMTEVLQFHKGLDRKAARARSVQLLDAVKIPDAAGRITLYPHEFSGGMRQRVMIAMALLCEPEVLIADEPTTALDVTVQAQIIALLRELQRDFGTAIIMITHDLGVVAGLCDEVMVLYGGRVMEQGGADSIFYRASHPYTVGLLGAIPRLDADDEALVAIPGAPPNMAKLPRGCPFSERCALASEECVDVLPALLPAEHDAAVLRACHRSVRGRGRTRGEGPPCLRRANPSCRCATSRCISRSGRRRLALVAGPSPQGGGRHFLRHPCG